MSFQALASLSFLKKTLSLFFPSNLAAENTGKGCNCGWLEGEHLNTHPCREKNGSKHEEESKEKPAEPGELVFSAGWKRGCLWSSSLLSSVQASWSHVQVLFISSVWEIVARYVPYFATGLKISMKGCDAEGAAGSAHAACPWQPPGASQTWHKQQLYCKPSSARTFLWPKLASYGHVHKIRLSKNSENSWKKNPTSKIRYLFPILRWI